MAYILQFLINSLRKYLFPSSCFLPLDVILFTELRSYENPAGGNFSRDNSARVALLYRYVDRYVASNRGYGRCGKFLFVNNEDNANNVDLTVGPFGRKRNNRR